MSSVHKLVIPAILTCVYEVKENVEISVKGLGAGYLGTTAVMSLMAAVFCTFSLFYPHIEKRLPA